MADDIGGESPTRTWQHSRKGRIRGVVVREDDTWIWVRLDGDHRLAYAAEANRGRIDTDGTAICLRKSLMVEVDGVA
ncbi:hypothetical protein [Mycobacteroides abscessus]|uniref:hypothetical protein n=1 Tax=Mycobacteroides abscessus TaxID=36809 RepID=UPI0005E0CA86|nr:hypothetical protein [Mycobacteroides abscessus]CPW40682.1 Uncharacterised protein [Mycobacteroides abscessus]SKF60081.1 Uncharacterised protein [Mycobacteroides abscessus subsp. bolletii]SKH51295.1 Uncharacterised protein [Mycobacteroides abscessus subsp. bolletii]